MIKHHPSLDILQAYAAGTLPASISAAVAMHVDMCPVCKKIVAVETQENAKDCFDHSTEKSFENETFDFDHDFDDIIAQITSDTSIHEEAMKQEKIIQLKNKKYILPKAIQNMNITNWSNIGKISRARVQLEEGNIRTSLLNIEAGAAVPEHTHKGYEVTLLLDGEFHDNMGQYVPGDFIVLDSENEHQPITEKGCLCYTVVSDSLHFTKGLNKLLNPIGSFIY